MAHGPHLNSYQRFLRSIVITVLSIAKPIETSVTWFLTGTAAITGLLITHIESITKLVNASSLKAGLVCLVVSMVAGVFARATGISISVRIAAINELNDYFNSADAQKDMAGMAEMKIEPQDIINHLASFFSWPISWAMRRGASNGSDFLSSEKACARSLSILVILIFIQQAMALIGLFMILLGL